METRKTLRDKQIIMDFNYLLGKNYKTEMVSEMVGFKYNISADRASKIFLAASIKKTQP